MIAFPPIMRPPLQSPCLLIGLVLGIFTLMIAACAAHRAPVPVFWDGTDALVYRGTLSKAANERVFQLYKKARFKPHLLKITSDGGDVVLGMDLGDWVFQNHLDVEIVDRCLSSCANYVFTAAKVKYLNPDAILMWHGGAHQQNLEKQYQALGPAGMASWDAWKRREDAFFLKIGVRQTITTYGQTVADPGPAQYSMGYDYSIADLEKFFGIANIVEKGGAWRWRELRPEIVSPIRRVAVATLTPP
jgi:hypothetical protein